MSIDRVTWDGDSFAPAWRIDFATQADNGFLTFRTAL